MKILVGLVAIIVIIVGLTLQGAVLSLFLPPAAATSTLGEKLTVFLELGFLLDFIMVAVLLAAYAIGDIILHVIRND